MSTHESKRIARPVVLAIVLLAPLLVYVSALRYQFVFDDPDQIVNNAAVHSWSSAPRYFTRDVWPHASSDEVGNSSRPTTWPKSMPCAETMKERFHFS